MHRFALSCLLLAPAGALAQGVPIPGPDAGTRRFGDDLVLLPNGGYLVTDPEWSAGPGAEAAGAIYHYAADGTLVGRLTGSAAQDRVGSGGIVVLASGDFVVHSPAWDAPGGVEDAGAVTWVDADAGIGLAASVGIDNSLVGGSPGDRVGAQRAVKLGNGSYVIASVAWDRPGVAVNAGAVTWCAADGSTLGAVSDANSLVGSRAEDRVGESDSSSRRGVIALDSGDYVVATPGWDNGPIANVGAVTWAKGDGSTGTGPVTAANSLVGTHPDDRVGSDVVPLRRAEGHYVVLSYLWDDDATANVGAVTWADGTHSTTGSVSGLNSLIGSQPNDQVGSFAAPLANGNFVVASPFWNNGPVQFAGAVTWRDGSAPQPGVVSPANSLVGASYADQIGYFTAISLPPLGVVPLPNGDYLVASPEWNRGPTRLRAGALTWGDGDGGTQGAVGVGNSLVGAQGGDAIAQYVRVLANGDFVVASPYWSQRRGAATWGDGQGPLIGVVGPENSLVGKDTTDFVTAYGIQALPDGGYSIPTPLSRRAADNAVIGAVTRVPPGGGLAGPVSAQNSFTGGESGDFAGSGGAIGLSDGDLLVRSELASGVGALTRIPADAAPGFVIAAGNSLLGTEDEPLGGPGAARLSDGAIVFVNGTGPGDGSITITLFAANDPFRGLLPATDTVRSTVADGASQLTWAYLAAQATLLVGDPVGNRIVRLTRSRLLHDGFEE